MSAEGNALLLATKDIVFDVAHNTDTSTSQSSGKGWGFANNTSGLPELTGIADLPVPKVVSIPGAEANIFVYERSDGMKIMLRDGSSSASQSGAKWTIDLVNVPGLKAKKVEVKFK